MIALPKPLKIKVLTLFLCGISSILLTSSARPSEKKEIVSVEKAAPIAARVQPLGLERLFEWEGRVYILAGPQDLQSLDRSGIPYLIESYKFPALNTKPVTLQSGINGDYHSYAELEADLQALERAYPQTARLFTIGQTLEGRNIYALKISDNIALDEDEAEVLFLGCHHAREWISVEVPFLLGKYLLEHYTTDAKVRRVVNESETWIVPLVNPDGLEYSIRYYRYWRKNRRLNADGSFGVDLNRNYDYAWGYDDEGSSPEPASEVYRGSAPFSEPETQAVRDFFGYRAFKALVSYHSYSQDILYPWGYTTAPTDQDALHESLAFDMSALMEEVNGRVYAFGPAAASLYLTNGDTTDWAFGISGIPAYTIELPPIDQLDGGFFNAEKDIEPIFRENLPAALYLINWSISNFTASPARSRGSRAGLLRGRDKGPDGRLP
jgi:carboxypeptidase T